MKTIHIFGTFAILAVLASYSSARVKSDWDPRTDFKTLRTYRWIDTDLSKLGYPALQSPLIKKRVQNAVDGELAARGYRRIESGTPDFRIAFQIVADGQSSESGLGEKKSGDSYSTRSPGSYEEARTSLPVLSYAVTTVSGGAMVHPVTRRGGYRYGRRGHHGYRHRPYRYRRPYRFYGHYGNGYRRNHYGFGLGYGYGQPYKPEPKIKSTLVLNVYDGSEDTLLWRGWEVKDLSENPEPKEVQKYLRKAVRKILKEFPPEA